MMHLELDSGFVDMSDKLRDQILASFGVPADVIGVPTPTLYGYPIVFTPLPDVPRVVTLADFSGYTVPRKFVEQLRGVLRHWDRHHKRKMKRQRREKGRRRQ